MSRRNAEPSESVTIPAPAPGVIPEYRSKRILESVGIPILAGELATDVSQALDIAERIGYPVALKAQAAQVSHKSDCGGVALHIQDVASLEAAWEKMQAALALHLPIRALDGILVEKMGPRGLEIIVGARDDPEWGVVLLVGFGGVLAEALQDVRLLAPELSAESIVEELHRLRSAPLLRGFRASPAVDVTAVARIAEKVSRLMVSCPWVREIDINPVLVYPEGAVALDALIYA